MLLYWKNEVSANYMLEKLRGVSFGLSVLRTVFSPAVRANLGRLRRIS